MKLKNFLSPGVQWLPHQPSKLKKLYFTKRNKIAQFKLLILKIIWLILFFASFCNTSYVNNFKGCFDGYFQEGDNCKPWHSSWKTWSDSASWDSWENYMMKNPTTQFWERCIDGEYFDFTSGVWDPCGGLWNNFWSYQIQCFECPLGKILDIESMEWVDSWISGSKIISPDFMNLSPIWRTTNYFIDPFSNELLEFGTLKYPYRTFKALSAEIINIHKHSNTNITIYTKDVYLEHNNLYLFNMSSVRIFSHPEYQNNGRRAVIISTSIPQHGISEKAGFHLLK